MGNSDADSGKAMVQERVQYQKLCKRGGNEVVSISVKCELYHDNFQNYKRYGIPKAQLVIADIPYNLGVNAYASNPE